MRKNLQTLINVKKLWKLNFKTFVAFKIIFNAFAVWCLSKEVECCFVNGLVRSTEKSELLLGYLKIIIMWKTTGRCNFKQAFKFSFFTLLPISFGEK